MEAEPLAKDDSALQELLGYGYFHLGMIQAEQATGSWLPNTGDKPTP